MSRQARLEMQTPATLLSEFLGPVGCQIWDLRDSMDSTQERERERERELLQIDKRLRLHWSLAPSCLISGTA